MMTLLDLEAKRLDAWCQLYTASKRAMKVLGLTAVYTISGSGTTDQCAAVNKDSAETLCGRKKDHAFPEKRTTGTYIFAYKEDQSTYDGDPGAVNCEGCLQKMDAMLDAMDPRPSIHWSDDVNKTADVVPINAESVRGSY